MNLNFGKTNRNQWFLIQFILNLVYIILIGLSKIITAWNFKMLIFSDFGAGKKHKKINFLPKMAIFPLFDPIKSVKIKILKICAVIIVDTIGEKLLINFELNRTKIPKVL